jgi:tRNA pseudouridine32 synthase/23S rRNA pseudouridine746 synthase
LIVHADDALVVAAKPAGLLAVPGRGVDKQDCLWRRVQREVPDALVVHRLDQATSGLMLFARGGAVQRRLGHAFMRRAVAKTYVAVVDGEMAQAQGTIELPLAPDWSNRPRQVVDSERGRPSLTRWRVVARLDGTTRVELEPVTGRTHQLRVHLLSIGHPVLGDTLYAPPDVAARAPRLLLHASVLALDHPLHGGRVAIGLPPPF